MNIFQEFCDDLFGFIPTKRGVIKWLIIFKLFLLLTDTAFALYNQGIPRVHNGHVIYVSHNYHKLYDYYWTDIEILTYSGDSHHVYFWGKVDFVLNTNYHIHTIKDYRLIFFPFQTWEVNELITEIEIID